MNCKNVRDQLATDYIDDELDKDARREIERHLESCAACRDYSEAIRRAAVADLRNAPMHRAPESVWREVRRQIEGEQSTGLFAALLGAARHHLLTRRAAFAAASVAAMIVAVIVLVRLDTGLSGGERRPSAAASDAGSYVAEQFLALSYLGADNEEVDNAGDNGYFKIASVDFGTVVEEYML